ncbi:dihydropteroate synthase [Micrococcus cohnii]|uniref:Dihydropteroate synthase n=1 Tax=Micrococcus cohnii TaxID=993416 RepID=A0A7W7GNT7_9MICC|nr:dihydropteroate synthase [uncultured Micrococcus sp.]MBB4735530.1 dihydropteroate synthase [Micrococcus cohnii]
MLFPDPPLRHRVHTFARTEVDLSQRILTMAVINRTPDSFYDAGATFALDDALRAARDAESDGADWLDVGGVPFAPGDELDPRHEADRVVPLIRALREDPDSTTILSADTFQPHVAEAALAAGADVVNDTSGLFYDDLARVTAAADAHLVVTHSLAHVHGPRTVVPAPHYGDVVAEVREHLCRTVDKALALGVAEEKIIVDPGHDLNKTTVHSLELTRRLDEIAALGFPVLAAVSNKDFVGESLDLPKSRRLAGSLAAAAACVAGGARILRMHNVAPSVQTARMLECIAGWRAPALAVHNTGQRNVDPDRSPVGDDPDWTDPSQPVRRERS